MDLALAGFLLVLLTAFVVWWHLCTQPSVRDEILDELRRR